MKSKIAGIGIAAAFAALLATGPSFGQMGSGGGSAPPAAAPSAPSGGGSAIGGGGGGGAISRGGGGGIAPQNAGPRGGNRGAFVGGGGSNRQAWRGGQRRGGYRGGYGSGVIFGTAPFWGGPYAYDDDYYVDAPAAAGGDVAYCMRRFKSYDPGSGTYLGFDGMRHPCP